ncbi:unnamed protein product [Zymoseptoria tritici ST99CH_1A5]|uniref:DUF1254 domain-containing protein n=1 Tax=Zymoseptoria tritici ST99CH_1A5 TaxID=1276529 RepID=A0A1Y6LNE1_ZYMTR|nr:unnamed protein product [Zymoseptoria tritici ST99CH_1A5]
MLGKNIFTAVLATESSSNSALARSVLLVKFNSRNRNTFLPIHLPAECILFPGRRRAAEGRRQRDLPSTSSGFCDILGVIKPNVDTVYSRVVLDLSKQDLVLTIPNITDRYWVYPVYDPFGNVIAEIGAVNNNTGGECLIRRADDVYAAPRFEASTPIHISLEGYQGIVNKPSTYGTMLVRLLVIQNTTEGLSIIRGYQNAIKLALNGSFLGIDSPAQQLEFAARMVPYTQAVAYSIRFRVASILSQAGLYNGHYHQPREVNLTTAGAIANSSSTLQRQSSDAIQQQGNGWTLQRDAYQGNYGTNYATAAYVALVGYRQLTRHQALYPELEGRGFSSVFQLEPNASLLVTLSGRPRLKEAGFWSLTVYSANQYLKPNVLDRYVVSDRTFSSTFQHSGKLVYGPDADEQEDGAFQILLQPADLPPPKNWTSNWLPVERDFSVILRFYFPESSTLHGTYVYPRVENSIAIVYGLKPDERSKVERRFRARVERRR